MTDSSATVNPTKDANDTAGEIARRHCLFLNQCASYFEKLAAESGEDLTFQAHSNNARNLLAAANFIALLIAGVTPAVKSDSLEER